MAIYNITYQCGHSGHKELFGKIADRDRYIAWCQEHKSCPACEKKEREKSRELASQQAMEEADLLGFAQLQGTIKQVNWAAVIRKEVVDKIEDSIVALERFKDHPDYERIRNVRIQYRDHITRVASAKFFIEVMRDISLKRLSVRILAYALEQNLDYPNPQQVILHDSRNRKDIPVHATATHPLHMGQAVWVDENDCAYMRLTDSNNTQYLLVM